MRLPPEPVLVAARRWLELLSSSGGIPRAQALLTTHPGFSDLTPTQYATALTWLRDLELLEDVGPPASAASQVLRAIFEKAAPPWVQDADRLIRSPEELPLDIVAAGEALGVDALEVYQALVASWGKVDTTARAKVGAAGEEALVALLRSVPGAEVEHVAARSDGYGYDIAVTHDGISAHLEVKSTTRLSRFTAYLSRHEHSVMLRDNAWALVTVRLTADLKIVGVGSVPREWIAVNAPRDDGPFGSWESVKLEVPSDVIVGGIPLLTPPAARLLPGW